MSRPLVAVCAQHLPQRRVTDWPSGGLAAQDLYLDGLRRAGVRPALIGGPDPDDGMEIAEQFAGVVLLGGGDIDPQAYGAVPHPAVYGVDDERDAFELALVRGALSAGKPIFGVCRGLQVLVVALGGTLVQHVPDLGSEVAHGRPSGDGVPAFHEVSVTPGSRLAAALGGAAALDRCISIHHQAAREVPAGLVVTARSGDGMVEAVETPADDPRWVLAVQWHPERSAASDHEQQALFNAFAAALPVRAPVW